MSVVCPFNISHLPMPILAVHALLVNKIDIDGTVLFSDTVYATPTADGMKYRLGEHDIFVHTVETNFFVIDSKIKQSLYYSFEQSNHVIERIINNFIYSAE